MNGIINVYKEKGYTSHDVVAKMRGILKMKKIGHTGTLDPDAEGVLPLCIGNATKVVELIIDKDKAYDGVMKLGVTTDTQDMTGRITSINDVNVKEDEVEEACKKFVGGYDQLPPMYSAVKVQGKRLYELARKGQEVERKKRPVIINEILIRGYNKEENEVSISVSCGKGTYIRTLIHDIGYELGCGASMQSLVRTRVGDFQLDNALKLGEIEELVSEGRIADHILAVDQMLRNYGKVVVEKEHSKLIYNGNMFYKKQVKEMQTSKEEKHYRVYDADNNFIAIYAYNNDKDVFRPVKMFLTGG